MVKFVLGMSLGLILSCIYPKHCPVVEVNPIKIDWEYETITLLLEDYQLMQSRIERD